MPKLSFFICAVLVCAPGAWACKCLPPSSQVHTRRDLAAWYGREAPVIFAGKAIEVSVAGWPPNPVPGKTMTAPMQLLVRFSDVHLYRGETAGDIAVSTGLGGGDCGFPFNKGEAYLVYAWRDDSGNLETGTCSGTMKLQEAGPELRLLNGEPPISYDREDFRASEPIDPHKLFRPDDREVCGKVSPPPGGDLNTGQAGAIRMFLWHADQDLLPLRFDSATADENGYYCFRNIDDGKYLIAAASPPWHGEQYRGFYPGVQERSKAVAVNLRARGKNPSVDFVLLRDRLASVKGNLRGAPANSEKSLAIVLMNEVPDAPSDFHPLAGLGPHGRFEFRDVPPGHYTVFAVLGSEQSDTFTFVSVGHKINVNGESIEGLMLEYVGPK